MPYQETRVWKETAQRVLARKTLLLLDSGERQQVMDREVARRSGSQWEVGGRVLDLEEAVDLLTRKEVP